MTEPGWDRLEVLLAHARSLPLGERTAFVERETGDDLELAAELSTLLTASDGAGEFVAGLRHELLGPDVTRIVREVPGLQDAPDPWVGRVVAHYEIVDRIGGGGMGVIYRARDVKLNRTVALKFIAPEIRLDLRIRQRFLEEARAASALDHPNICTIHDIAESDDGRMFIVMAAYEGETLRDRIERGPLSEQETLAIAEQIAAALSAAHERGIVHRDVKPGNVFVTRTGVVKLLDFGLARTADGPAGAATEGTVAYLSPEQASGRTATERSDVWALGVIIFEMLAGGRPFDAADPSEAIERIIHQEVDLRALAAEVSADLRQVVERALSKDPANRYANGAQILDALKACAAAPPPASSAGLGGCVAGARASGNPPTLRARASRCAATVFGVLAISTLTTAHTRGIPGAFGPAAGQPPVSHVLWVDDNPENNADIIRALAERGVAVTSVHSTAEALERFDPAIYQFVVSDLGRYEGEGDTFVGRAGFQLLERLRARGDTPRFVFYTSGRAAELNRSEALAAGALDMVADPDAVLHLIGIQP